MSELSSRKSKRRKLAHDSSLKGGLAESSATVAKETAEVAEESHKHERTQWMSGIRVPHLIRPESSYKADARVAADNLQSERAVLDQLIVRGTRPLGT